jgi:transposase
MHDFALLKSSKTKIHTDTHMLGDSAYQGQQKLHAKTSIPKKRSKKTPLSDEDKCQNKALSSERIVVENVLAMLKRFRIIAERYRNRRRRFGLRFSLIVGMYNAELDV